ncbi:hypothetical protein ANCCEY_06968 [Ancylostoma ceylanicum]|uniref:Uncharacterized protein n=1 Tax=Ancylostoma ceylanicum TaxID=53326 RepID=A0A0D6LQ14_9BILA|nr:hypothetical protein ANCCEY_06968 [Ancylostoma ceylanicum]
MPTTALGNMVNKKKNKTKQKSVVRWIRSRIGSQGMNMTFSQDNLRDFFSLERTIADNVSVFAYSGLQLIGARNMRNLFDKVPKKFSTTLLALQKLWIICIMNNAHVLCKDTYLDILASSEWAHEAECMSGPLIDQHVMSNLNTESFDYAMEHQKLLAYQWSRPEKKTSPSPRFQGSQLYEGVITGTPADSCTFWMTDPHEKIREYSVRKSEQTGHNASLKNLPYYIESTLTVKEMSTLGNHIY